MSSPTLDLDTVDLSDRSFWGAPPEQRHAVYDQLRRERPFAFFAEPVIPYIEPGPGYHAVTRYADVEAISCRPALFSSGAGAVSIADMPPDLNEFYGSLISMDDPRHGKIRRIVAKAFTPRVLEKLVGNVQAVADDVVTRARRTAEDGDGTIDVVADLAAPIPLRVICDMMGIPDGDRALVLRQSNVILSGGDPELVEDEEQMVTAFLKAGEELAGLMARLAAERHAHPADDLTTALVTTEVDGERLTHQEIASFFILLLVAGNETTRNAISQGVLALSEHPGERARWAADPGLTRTAVEEIVRWTSPISWMRRTATQDVELSGQSFPAGSKFLLFYGAANRDPAVFADPHRFDLSRDPNPHVGFGSRGPHFCLGAHLARREIGVAFRAFADQLPDLEVIGPPARLESSFVNGLKRLPARLTGVR
ncbi:MULTISPECIES: cytochrome P450 [unclassified Modestobacter]|uniref:cytochrome P450 n=1 Tax=unclassified Modestobacter TaxID=2643866 RepID=UPI0022AA3E7C|nr:MULTISPECIES: cytochrome P450 [unclassified Modestobacter]MCZ2823891.1 cytochrome P450 [Modestobacter sp. VKM Ac-2981]MCZ2852136.1 cytochrome P450 [Modestobacter sp. VKM Ac-2982]